MKLRTLGFTLLLVSWVLPILGCAKKIQGSPTLSEGLSERMPEADRVLIWQASLCVKVNNVISAVQQATSIVDKVGGYIENKGVVGDETAHLTLRVPTSKLTSVLDPLSALGDEKRRWISSKDVTEQYIDTEARLKNALALRDRLKELLKQANGVKDILEIEKEMTRIQSEIDSMEGNLMD